MDEILFPLGIWQAIGFGVVLGALLGGCVWYMRKWWQLRSKRKTGQV